MQLSPPALPAAFAAFLQELAVSHGVWVVGGWVRDSLTDAVPHDADFATSAAPSAVRACAKRHRLHIIWDKVAEQHGTYRLHLPNSPHMLDLATLRRDVAQRGARHAEVAFTTEIEEDLRRRDLTINGMAIALPWQPPVHIIDPHGGQADLLRQRLKLIGTPADRLREDPLRLLRVARFACLAPSWQIDGETAAALHSSAHLLATVSRERLQQEMWRAMGMPAPWRFWQVLQQAEAIPQLLPLPAAPGPVDIARGCSWLRACAARTGAPLLRCIAFFAGALAPPQAAEVAAAEAEARRSWVLASLRGLRFAKGPAIEIAQATGAFIGLPQALAGDALAAWLVAAGPLAVPRLAVVHACAAEAGYSTPAAWAGLQARIDAMLGGAAVPSLAELAVKGADLTAQGIVPPGPAIGQALRALLLWGIAHGRWQDRQALLAHVPSYWAQQAPDAG